MIRSFADRATERLFRGERLARFARIEATAYRKLTMLDAAKELRDLQTPGNRLEALRGKWRGLYSIRINSRWRLRFAWSDGNADAVEVIDYH